MLSKSFVKQFWMALNIKPQSAILCAILTLVIPLPWLLAWIIAAITHEICHCIAVWVCGGRIEQICVSLHGAEIHTCLKNKWQTIFCILSGPAGGLFLLLFSDSFPRIAVCALFQSIYNLIPLYPLDGGRALESFLKIVLPDIAAGNIFHKLEMLTILSIIFGGVVLSIYWKLGWLPVLFILYLLIQTKKIKIPCK